MNTTITRKVTAAIAAAAATAGIFSGIALAAPAQAEAVPTAPASCSTSSGPSRMGDSSPNPLTRAGQVNAIGKMSSAAAAATSCLSR